VHKKDSPCLRLRLRSCCCCCETLLPLVALLILAAQVAGRSLAALLRKPAATQACFAGRSSLELATFVTLVYYQYK